MSRLIDLNGQVFGSWLVLEKSAKRRHWTCRCSCGRVVDVYSMNLRTGKSRGCAPCRRRKKPFESVYNGLARAAKERRVPLALTYEDFLEFTRIENCHYCDSKISWFPHTKLWTPERRRYHLDRRDSTAGYTKENCVVCCTHCNYIKGAGVSYQTMLEFGKILKQRGENINDIEFSNRRKQVSHAVSV